MGMTSSEGSRPSRRQAWFMVMVLLVDDVAVLALVALGLWYFDVEINWVVIMFVAAGMAGFIFLVHRAIVPALLRRRVTGREGMLGMSGRVTLELDPKGMVEIKGEYWQARSIEGKIDIGATVEVVGMKGLVLEVREKSDE